jgi:hypothetical protein
VREDQEEEQDHKGLKEQKETKEEQGHKERKVLQDHLLVQPVI